MNTPIFVTECRICGETLIPMLDLGTQPPANAFLREEELDIAESVFPLRTAVCPTCFSVQLQDTIDPASLFSRDYYYLTGASAPLTEHFQNLGTRLAKDFSLTRNDLVVEFGSNDGVLLSAILPHARVLGVDPAHNVGKEAEKRSVPTMQAFFGNASAQAVRDTHGPAKLILANNVFAHIPDIHDVLRGVSELLTDDGQFIAEVHWVGNLIGEGGFDQIYHEHIYYFSVHTLKHLIENVHGLTLAHVELISIHGQSLRIFVSKEKVVNHSVTELLNKEKELGLDRVKTYTNFSDKVLNNKIKTIELLRTLKRADKKIVGYGAPAKGNTLLNFIGIGPDILDYITDTTPTKQGAHTPGSHIPIISPEILQRETPDYILLLSWNYADSILKKEQELRQKGVKFIIPVPDVRIV